MGTTYETDGGAIEQMAAARPNVLVVDDDPITRLLVRSRLESLGATVVEAADGIDGLVCLVSTDFDLLIVDVEMPRMNGFELIGWVRRCPQRHQLPIIVLTGDERPGAIDAAEAVGATSLLMKPLNWTSFGTTVQQILKFGYAVKDRERDAVAFPY